ncbi:MAG: hypothetical protein K2L30_11430 [Duncaniella sp.]|nr:hypothetical protein [Duncaniella sp.]
MINNYIKRSALLLGAVAMIGTSAMAAQKWQPVTYLMNSPAGIPGWAGALTDVNTTEGVGEIYDGAGRVYQVIENLPAGEYTLTMNGFLRASDNKAYIFINDTKAALASHNADCNDLAEANTLFKAGKYLNTVKANHPGGDLTIGVCNPGFEFGEWMAFDNFELNGPNGKVEVVNGDFSGHNIDFTVDGWACENGKKPEVKKGGGAYSKTNASPYDIHQTVTLPAGKYRVAVNSFFRHGQGNTAGGAYSIKGADAELGTWFACESAWDRHVAGKEDPLHNAYIYVNEGEWDNDIEGLKEDGLFYYQTAIKNIFDLGIENTKLPDNSWEGMGTDSGQQNYAAEFFINNADLTSNYVEFTLDAETKVSFGIKKDVNAPSRYWHPFADLRIEKLVDAGDVEPIEPTEGEWYNVSYLLNSPAGIPGWAGALTDVNTTEGVGEIYDGAGRVYQVIENLPAGEYTLTMNGFLRASDNKAYIFINDTKAALASHNADCNDLAEANTLFKAGKYLNTVKANHPGGDLTIGVCNPGFEFGEWMAFDNFELNGPNGKVEVVNGDFSGHNIDFTVDGWACENGKKPEVKKGGGAYSKTNASPYDIHQTVTLPAGKYRVAVNSFFRHGQGNTAGGAYSIKGADAELGTWFACESAWDRHVAGKEDPLHNAYIYVNEGEWDNDIEGLKEDGLFYYQTAIKNIFDLGIENTKLPDNSWEGMGTDSGQQNYAAEFFINNADLTSNYVEFTLDAETEVSMGIKKDVNAPSRYWHPFADFRLEKLGAAQSAVDNVFTDAVEEDPNAPVEYYNLQGVKVNVENAAPGLYIVKQGKKVTKQIIR